MWVLRVPSTSHLGLLAFAVVTTLVSPAAAVADLAGYVDPFIGTGGHGHTFPGPTLPFGMAQPGPDTRLSGWDGCSGYHHDDTVVYGFSHTHLSGTGISDYGDVLLLPATGELKLESGYGRPPGAGYGSRFGKASERAEAGYYRVRLDDYGVEAELTATLRTGWHRYTFPKSDSAHVLLDLGHRDTVLESSLRVVDDQTIEGMRRSKAWAADQVVYFVAAFSRPFDAVLAVDGQLRPGLREARGTRLEAALRYRTRAGEKLLVKVGISAVDLAGARRNLAAEGQGWDFDGVRGAARRAWNDALGVIRVEGGTAEERVIFYTALYHAFLQPNLFQDVDGRYRGMDKRIRRARDYTRYTVFSLWDTFRAAHPLYTLVQPRRAADFVRTFVEMYREGGRLPVWELAGNETDTMIGYHAASVILDAWVKGIRWAGDPALALEAMKASADGDRFGLRAYREHGYIPADEEAESVSKTLEYAYDDWCIGRFAQLLGKAGDARRFLSRAEAWQHLLDPQGFMRARAGGRFLSPFDPAEVNFHYTEANAWQYSFFVPHDVAGWMARLGGPAALERHLDALFAADSRTRGREQADITGLIGQYAHGNEPSHHMAYLYAFTGTPDKTQRLVRRIRKELYSDRPDGLAGNEDCGQMSAWYVLSALGLYPVTPGSDQWVLGAPLFDKATLDDGEGHRFVVRARRSAPGAAYVRSVRLGRSALSSPFVSHAGLLTGAELVFEMDERPSTWGRRIEARPVAAAAVVPAPVAEGPALAAEDAELKLVAADPGDAIHYTLDGRLPDEAAPVYRAPLRVAAPGVVTFRARRGSAWSPVVTAPVRRLDPTRRVVIRSPVNPQYTGGGDQALVDGVVGRLDFRLGGWQGFEGVELVAELDLGEPRDVRRVSTGFLHDPGSWIFLPLEVRYAVSEDGRTWRSAGTVTTEVDPRHEDPLRQEFSLTLAATAVRYLRVETRSRLRCPDWHKGAGGKAHVFADEIVVTVADPISPAAVPSPYVGRGQGGGSYGCGADQAHSGPLPLRGEGQGGGSMNDAGPVTSTAVPSPTCRWRSRSVSSVARSAIHSRERASVTLTRRRSHLHSEDVGRGRVGGR